MFAVIEDGSRQFRVQKGDRLTVDFRANSQEGDAISFDRVLLANAGGASVIGRPTIDGASVEAEVVYPLEKGPKLEVQKIRRRKNSKRHTGHRQKYTSVLIKSIDVPGLEIVEEEPPAETPEPEAAETTEAPAAEESADAASEESESTDAESSDESSSDEASADADE